MFMKRSYMEIVNLIKEIERLEKEIKSLKRDKDWWFNKFKELKAKTEQKKEESD